MEGLSPNDALLLLIAELRQRIEALVAKNRELHAACAELQEEVTQLKAASA